LREDTICVALLLRDDDPVGAGTTTDFGAGDEVNCDNDNGAGAPLSDVGALLLVTGGTTTFLKASAALTANA
jgi:hypothetical protein